MEVPMETFVRKDFYIQPPAKNAKPEEWTVWQEKDRRAAIAARRSWNKLHAKDEVISLPEATSTLRVGGVWKQTTALGFVGGSDDSGGHLEPIVEATQERDYIRARMTGTDRGVSHTRSVTSKHKARRDKRKARKGGN
jgi:hypothetical protein